MAARTAHANCRSVRTRRTAMAAIQVTATTATAHRHHAVRAQIRDAAAVDVAADVSRANERVCLKDIIFQADPLVSMCIGSPLDKDHAPLHNGNQLCLHTNAIDMLCINTVVVRYFSRSDTRNA